MLGRLGSEFSTSMFGSRHVTGRRELVCERGCWFCVVGDGDGDE